MTKYFEFQMSVKVCCGEKALEHLAYELRGLNCKKPLIITDPTLKKLGMVDLATESLAQGTPFELFDEVPQDSGLEPVEKAAQRYRDCACDGIVAIGGGSVLDTAKGVRVLLSANAQKVTDVLGCEEMTRGALVPFIAVPTTSGTGSEATTVAVIADAAKGVKLEFITDKMQPDVAFLDARMTEKLPARLTASTGADALCHAIEAYSCIQKNPLSDAFALQAVDSIVKNLPVAVKSPSNAAARLALAQASFMAGAAFSNSMVGAVHAIGHALGGVCHVPHGDAMSILLPYVMRYNASDDLCAKSYAGLAGVLGAKPADSLKEQVENVIESVENLLQALHKSCGLPVKLSETGRVEKDALDAVCEKALNDGALLFNPKALTATDVKHILEQAY